MTEDMDGPLQLAGYVRLAESGFALPAWSAGPGSNAWYSAVPTIEGDHNSTIAAFELLELEQVTLLSGTPLLAAPGAAWLDVFLWNGEAFAGAPEEIFVVLAPHAADILRVAPLSYLDLALAAGAPGTVGLALEARAFLQRHVSGARSTRAFCNLVLRPGILVALRRQEHRSGRAGVASALAGEISVREVGANLFEASMPPGIAQILGGQAAADRLDAAITAFGDRLGASLRARYRVGEAERTSNEVQMPTPVRPEPLKRTDSDWLNVERPGIGVIALDRRALQIAHHLDTSFGRKKVSEDLRPSGGLRIDTDIGTRREAIIHVTSNLSAAETVAACEVVVCLVSNELLRDADACEHLTSMASAIGASRPFLLAPVAPIDGPSLLLNGAGAVNELLDQCSAVIETTLARSPSWTGHQRRSVDRRMADIIASIGTAVIADRHLYEQFMALTGAGPKVISIYFEGVVGPDVGPLSELNASLPGDLALRVSMPIRDHSDDTIRPGIIELRTLRQDFRRLAEAAMLAELGPGLTMDGEKLPEPVREVLDQPAQAAAIRLESHGGELAIITAERPDLTTLRAARRLGAAVVRYTDRQALRALLGGEDGYALPSEIRLPPLHRYTKNRGLATRGVDTRDIIRLSQSHWAELLATLGDSVLLKEARRYRAALRAGAKDEPIAIPALAIHNAATAGDALAQSLVEQTRHRESRSVTAGKRISDLAAAWSHPSRGGRRWIIEDGLVPVEIAALSADEVPAQRLFLVDGDEAVPALLRSRLFAVWARALLPSSTSWSSRFQVAYTFDAFPLTLSFVVTPAMAGSPPQLQLSRQSDSFSDLMNLLRSDPDASKLPTSDRRNIETRLHDVSVMRDVNAILLADIGLGPNADDLDILERLIERNRLRQ